MNPSSAGEGQGQPRRRGGWVLVLLVVFGLGLTLRFSASPPARYCAPGIGPEDKLVMLSTTWCPYCARARELLAQLDVDYCELDTETSAAGRRLYAATRAAGVPVFLHRGELVYGFSERRLVALLDAHSLIGD